MSVSVNELRREARLLSARIAEVEMMARGLRNVASVTDDDSFALYATKEATHAEATARRMASRLACITRNMPGDFPL